VFGVFVGVSHFQWEWSCMGFRGVDEVGWGGGGWYVGGRQRTKGARAPHFGPHTHPTPQLHPAYTGTCVQLIRGLGRWTGQGHSSGGGWVPPWPWVPIALGNTVFNRPTSVRSGHVGHPFALVYIRAVASCELLQELVEFNKRYSTNPEDVVAALSADPSLYVSWGTASLFDNEIAPSLV
jgi:hypothetical protein